jgi:single-strand DNA-binding protein
MPSLNKVFLMGNLTRDPELRYIPSGTAVCEFGLAINHSYTGRDGQRHDSTCFVDVTMWGRRGEVIAEYFQKGRPIFIEGRLNFDSWEAQDGTKRSKLRVVADSFEFIGGRGDGRGGGGDGGDDGGGRGGGGGGQRRSQGQAPSNDNSRNQRRPEPQRPAKPAPSPPPPDDGFDVADDDIPF